MTKPDNILQWRGSSGGDSVIISEGVKSFYVVGSRIIYVKSNRQLESFNWTSRNIELTVLFTETDGDIISYIPTNNPNRAFIFCLNDGARFFLKQLKVDKEQTNV